MAKDETALQHEEHRRDDQNGNPLHQPMRMAQMVDKNQQQAQVHHPARQIDQRKTQREIPVVILEPATD